MPDNALPTPTDGVPSPLSKLPPRGYQQEMLDQSLRRNIVVALDTGAGKTHIAVLRMKHEIERESPKVSWFLVPTVALAQQQRDVIAAHLPVSVGLISGANEPDRWKNPKLWRGVLNTHRVVVTTPDVLLNGLRHGYIHLGRDIGLLVFDEAHHAADKHSYNLVMREFYDKLPPRSPDSGVHEVVRPMILGLTASPIFGGDAERASRQLEHNLDATICAPLLFREELEGFVHRPQFKHIMYAKPNYFVDTPTSSSLQSLKKVVASLDINEDPWVIDRRVELRQLKSGPRYHQIDQQLSKAIDKNDTFTHKDLRYFERAADEICSDLGEWAADWFIQQVCQQVASAGETFPEFSVTWSESERKYLLGHLSRVEIAPVPDDDPEDIPRRSSDKVEKLVDALLHEKALFESLGMEYRGLVFVMRRDTVLALTEILVRHPRTAHVFNVGSLLGESGNSRRRSFLDVTRRLLRKPANETLADFRIGDLDLIVGTAVAEEGLDIQACCNVVRWDLPMNMVSWAQSRGRARQKHSSFILMLSDSLADVPNLREWVEQEKKMTEFYKTREEHEALYARNEDQLMDDNDDGGGSGGRLLFTVEETGAMLTGSSAVEHIFHFCSILPFSGLANTPLFDLNPPDYPLEWHADRTRRPPYAGPYGCTLTLPRQVDPRLRSFSTPRVHRTKVSARRNVAFQAYYALYENGLLNGHLLPLTSAVMESEVQDLLKDIERRKGTALVSSQMDPWRVSSDGNADKQWWSTILEVDGLPSLRMLTQAVLPLLREDELPLIHTRECPPFKVWVRRGTPILAGDEDGILARAKEFTRRFFWPIYGSRMKWDQTDFLHLFIPVDESPTVWDERRTLASDLSSSATGGQTLFAPFSWFERHHSQVEDVFLVSGTRFSWKSYQFTRMRDTPLCPEEKADLIRRYVRKDVDDGTAKLEITYPLIEARPLVKRKFLTPMPEESKGMDAVSQKPVLLLKEFALVTLISSHEAQYAQWAPSIIRHFQMVSTVSSMRGALFRGTPLAEIPLDLLLTATTAPVAQERSHYQRLETLGDTTLKYAVSIQLLSANPLWHEGYLSRRKDHAVSNVNLAKAAMARHLYKWIIRDRFVPQRWKPRHASDPPGFLFEESPSLDTSGMTEKQKRRAKAARNLSTKVLADVVEALIGAAYLHGGFALGIECMKVFDLGLKSWSLLPECIDAMYSRVTDIDRYPAQIAIVESILGYTFRRKAVAVEALTHASYQSDLETISYERMEFLGDAVLDMLVTDYLYRAPGKNYGPGGIHEIKTAVVNAHFLAMLCLRASNEQPVFMPTWTRDDGVTLAEDTQHVHLYRCLLHSSMQVLNDQQATFTRFERPGGRDDIQATLEDARAFPWSALTALQAPKFLSDMFESLLGAVYLDSFGNLDVVRDVLRRLGHWEVLERIVERDVDVRHPVSRLNIWAAKNHEKVKCSTQRNENRVSCSVIWDKYEVTKVEDEWRGRVSQEGVRFAAAEKAVALLEDPVSLLQIWLAKRNRSIEYSIEEVGGMCACTVIVDGTVITTVEPPNPFASSEDTKRAAAAEAFKKLEEPVHWLAFLSAQYHFEVEYLNYEEEGVRVCRVYLDGIEAGRKECPIRGPGPVVTERGMMEGAAKDAIEGVEQRIMDERTSDDVLFS